MGYHDIKVTGLGMRLMRRRAGQTLDWLIGARRVLELGPGRGVVAQEAVARGLEYWAVDRDLDVLNHLPRGAHALCFTVPPIPESLGSFDGIVAENILEHLSGYDVARQFLIECRGHLRPGGRLVLRVPDIRFYRWKFWDWTEDHQYVTSRTRVLRLVQSVGLRPVKTGYYLDCWTGWKARLLGLVLRLNPVSPFVNPDRMSVWVKLAYKRVQVYLVCE